MFNSSFTLSYLKTETRTIFQCESMFVAVDRLESVS